MRIRHVLIPGIWCGCSTLAKFKVVWLRFSQVSCCLSSASLSTYRITSGGASESSSPGAFFVFPDHAFMSNISHIMPAPKLRPPPLFTANPSPQPTNKRKSSYTFHISSQSATMTSRRRPTSLWQDILKILRPKPKETTTRRPDPSIPSARRISEWVIIRDRSESLLASADAEREVDKRQATERALDECCRREGSPGCLYCADDKCLGFCGW